MNHVARYGLSLDELKEMDRQEREIHANQSGFPVFYLAEEARACKALTEERVLRAAPSGFPLSSLNGLNIGAGSRKVSEYLTPIDLSRQHEAGPQLGSLLSPMAPLPFRDETVDYIVSLHALEHIPNPVEVIDHWLNVIKPGGGIGLILPDWRYCWDARSDVGLWGHKWNTEPKVLHNMHARHWASRCSIEALDTYDWKISFDVILRKHGKFEPFNCSSFLSGQSGRDLALAGKFVSDQYQ